MAAARFLLNNAKDAVKGTIEAVKYILKAKDKSLVLHIVKLYGIL